MKICGRYFISHLVNQRVYTSILICTNQWDNNIIISLRNNLNIVLKLCTHVDCVDNPRRHAELWDVVEWIQLFIHNHNSFTHLQDNYTYTCIYYFALSNTDFISGMAIVTIASYYTMLHYATLSYGVSKWCCLRCWNYLLTNKSHCPNLNLSLCQSFVSSSNQLTPCIQTKLIMVCLFLSVASS